MARSPCRAALRSMRLDKRNHGIERLHRIGLEWMLVEEGVTRAFQKQQIHAAASLAIIVGKALREIDRCPLILRALEHQNRRQIDLLAALDNKGRRRLDLGLLIAEENIVAFDKF